MKDLVPSGMWPIVFVGIAIWILAITPLLYSAFVALRTRPLIPRRILFVAVITGMSYGFMLLFAILVTLPLEAFSTFIAPQLQAIGHLPRFGLWLAEISQALSSWGWFVIPLVDAIASIWFTRYLVRRWPQVVASLGPNNSFKPKPLRGSA